jgi:hypothetical protein
VWPCLPAKLPFSKVTWNPSQTWNPSRLAQVWGSRKNAPEPREYQIGSSTLCTNVPRSISPPLSSQKSSGSSSAKGGGVDVRGRDGSGRIRSLATRGLSNFVPARLCVGVSLCWINIC